MGKNRGESSKDPMSPGNITEHEPTAVRRDLNDQEIVEGERQVQIPQKLERSLKSGMTKV
jgi:hypothetical protein